MKTSDFNFILPDELVARYPLPSRSESRLMYVDQADIQHKIFQDLPFVLNDKDLLVFNNTRVIRARLFAYKETGGKVEILIERILGDTLALAHVKANKSIRLPCRVQLPNNISLTITERQQEMFTVEFHSRQNVAEILKEIGTIPLPHYMQRAAQELDEDRYQTIYASAEGAVAAPTAGLHFDEDLLTKISHKGIDSGFITLHVGAGTFKPVKVEDPRQHQMHHEYFSISEEVCGLVNNCKRRGGRVIAVGTTTVRALETAMQNKSQLTPCQGETNIFIYPGFRFKCVDAMITNFHLPQSTLLMLVCAFGGYSHVMPAYEMAIANRYRFYSYGDAMILFREVLNNQAE
jgi:S-adenosylmethionine:tRNA ribosyltransferase-isomerase